MKDKIFVDTSVVLYLLSNDSAKKSVSKGMLKSNHHISTQVLNEFANISLKKFKLSISDTKEAIGVLTEILTLLTFDEATINQALEIKERYGFQYYDSLILASAIQSGCNILYSEDMQHNQTINKKLKIINPYI